MSLFFFFVCGVAKWEAEAETRVQLRVTVEFAHLLSTVYLSGWPRVKLSEKILVTIKDELHKS